MKPASRVFKVLPGFLVLVLLVIIATGYQFPLVQAAVQIPLAILYPIKLRRDVRWLESQGAAWSPSPAVYTLLGITVTLTLGLTSLFVSPYYLYRRRSALA